MKKAAIVMGIGALVILAGCGSNTTNGKSGNNEPTSSKSVNETGYQKLSKADQNNVSFKFAVSKDEESSNYSISGTIKNNSKKVVTIDESYFHLVRGKKSIKSASKEKVSVKAGQQITVNELFKNVDSSLLSNGKVSIQYFDSANVVATPDFSDDIDTGDETDQTDNTNQSTGDTTSDNDSNDSQDTSGNIVDSSAKAISLFNGAVGEESSVTATDNGSDGYTINDSDGKSVGTVMYNGDTIVVNGPMMSYDENPNA
ncbi:hypothetical protein [Companilactobacillus sp.]|jgi:hypothetical protein|uniref:hypothetical protein n=1 Tax=Companilactobacillus sp. TaxID=2767905 RepID=UPI0025BF8691|nr:hypothetical protein [Companilactobacillus sp.]MCH4009415.1 hypothetical protein [Companilactobacillus sp.]MCH4050406.1 hypothetical protein [Companilactobacillus sp.]MCH4077357.1 hypothetical protein [Companilactobacillus sp.]MCH4125933.1 hypothetical protein [Companilactobacillus sp.]MCI1311642.1 hypothetical protein [Companilactobacillus sp.]